MIVSFTAQAESDLGEIADFIRPHNSARALSFVEELHGSCLSIADKARAYPLVPMFEIHGIRRSIHKGYLIFYRSVGDSVEIIRILHGARDYEALLFGDP